MRKINHTQYILNQEDLHLFKVFCQFVWFQGEPLPLIFDIENEVYVKQGITLSTLKRLEEIGLIIFESNGYIKKRLGQHTRLFYKGKPTKIGFPGKIDNQLDVGHVLLTATGKDRALACETSWNQEFYEYVIRRWYQQGFVLSSIQIDRQFLKE